VKTSEIVTALKQDRAIGQANVQALVAESLGLESLSDLAVRLLDRLQGIHDLHGPEDWQQQLTVLARDWDFDKSALSGPKAVR
jgi:hypothetical protein